MLWGPSCILQDVGQHPWLLPQEAGTLHTQLRQLKASPEVARGPPGEETLLLKNENHKSTWGPAVTGQHTLIYWTLTPRQHSKHSMGTWVWVCECVCAGSCPTLCDPMDCSPPGAPVHGTLWARILEWVLTSSSRGSSQPRDCLSCLLHWQVDSYHHITWEAPRNHLHARTILWTASTLQRRQQTQGGEEVSAGSQRRWAAEQGLRIDPQAPNHTPTHFPVRQFFLPYSRWSSWVMCERQPSSRLTFLDST